MEEVVMETEGKREVPENFGPLRDANGNARLTGSCGDTVEIWVHVGQEAVEHASATSDGCADSILACCTVASLVRGMPVETARSLSEKDVLSVLKDFPQSSVHCVALALDTLHEALDDYAVKEARSQERTIVPSPALDGEASGAKERRTAHRDVGKRRSWQEHRCGQSRHLPGERRTSGRFGRCRYPWTRVCRPCSISTMSPCIPRRRRFFPVVLGDLFGLEVMSLGFLLQKADDPVILAGPAEEFADQTIPSGCAMGGS